MGKQDIEIVTDEMVAAFLEGNASPAEASLILSQMTCDKQLREALGVVMRTTGNRLKRQTAPLCQRRLKREAAKPGQRVLKRETPKSGQRGQGPAAARRKSRNS